MDPRRKSLSVEGTPSTPTNAADSGSAPPPPASPSSFSYVRTFARVRPLLKDEAKKIPEYFPVARPAVITTPVLDLDDDTKAALAKSSQKDTMITPTGGGHGKEMVVIMDPDKKFTQKPKGAFAFQRVFPASNLNEFEDPPIRPVPPATIGEVFSEVRPIVEHTASRKNSCVIVCGGQKSGKLTTMFGDITGTDQEARGILPRFAMEVFRAMQAVKLPNAELSIVVEFVEVSGENVTDLLLSSQERSTAFPLKLKDEGHSLVTLTHCKQVPVSDGPMMLSQIKMGLRNARKNKNDKNTHLIFNFRVTEKADFEHPDDSTQRVTKVSRYWAQFVVMTQMPSPFVRCIDIAAQKDTAGTSLKVPVRDSMVTRLAAEAFGGNCETYCVLCISPYYAHVKETFTACDAVCKFGRVRCRAVVSADSQTSTFRRLHDEMSGISSELKTTSKAHEMVQNELDERQEKFESAAEALEAQQTVTAEAEKRFTAMEIVKIVKAVRLLRLRKAGDDHRKQLERELQQADQRLKDSLKKIVEISQVNEDLAEDVDKVRDTVNDFEKTKEKMQDNIDEFKSRHEEAEILKSDPGAAAALAQREHETKMKVLTEREDCEKAELARANLALSRVEGQHAAAKKEVDDLEAPKKRLDAATEKNEKLKQEQTELQQEIERLEFEIANVEAQLNKSEGCTCAVQ